MITLIPDDSAFLLFFRSNSNSVPVHLDLQEDTVDHRSREPCTRAYGTPEYSRAGQPSQVELGNKERG